MASEIDTGGGASVGGDANVGGPFTGRDHQEARQEARADTRNSINVSLANQEHLEIIRYQLTRLGDNFDFRLTRLEDNLNNRLRPMERDIEEMKQKLSKTQNDVDELKSQSIVVKFTQQQQPPVASNGNLRRIFWALVGVGFLFTVLISVLIVMLARGFH